MGEEDPAVTGGDEAFEAGKGANTGWGQSDSSFRQGAPFTRP